MRLAFSDFSIITFFHYFDQISSVAAKKIVSGTFSRNTVQKRRTEEGMLRQETDICMP
jgi:hypothetical protein